MQLTFVSTKGSCWRTFWAELASFEARNTVAPLNILKFQLFTKKTFIKYIFEPLLFQF